MGSLRKIAVGLVPQSVKDGIGLLHKYLYKGTEYQCPICMSSLKCFFALPKKFDVIINIKNKNYTVNDFETLNIENYMCPVCRCSDRDRLIALFLNNKPEISELDNVLIHFAPEKALSSFLRQIKKHNYLTIDLYMENVDHNLDITNMDIMQSDSVDCFVCSHILEHIPDDTKALQELFRILKPESWGIIMVPLIPSLDRSYEDFSLTSKEERLLHFGQEDHVRVYSKSNFIEKLEHAGFTVFQMGVDHFGKTTFIKSGISIKSVLYVVKKL